MPQPYEQEPWFKAQTPRWEALADQGWIFSHPDLPQALVAVAIHMVSTALPEPLVGATFVVSAAAGNRETINTALLEACERWAWANPVPLDPAFLPESVTDPDDLRATFGKTEFEEIATAILAFLRDPARTNAYDDFHPKTGWQKSFAYPQAIKADADVQKYDLKAFAALGWIDWLRYDYYVVSDAFIRRLQRREVKLAAKANPQPAATPEVAP